MRHLYISLYFLFLTKISFCQDIRYFDLNADPLWKNPALTGVLGENNLKGIGVYRIDSRSKIKERLQTNISLNIGPSDSHHSAGFNFYHRGLFKHTDINEYSISAVYSYSFYRKKFNYNIGVLTGLNYVEDKLNESKKIDFQGNLGFTFFNESITGGVSIINIGGAINKSYLEGLRLNLHYSQDIELKNYRHTLTPIMFLNLGYKQFNASIELDYTLNERYVIGAFYRTNIKTGGKIGINLYLVELYYTFEVDFESVKKNNFNSGTHIVKLIGNI